MVKKLENSHYPPQPKEFIAKFKSKYPDCMGWSTQNGHIVRKNHSRSTEISLANGYLDASGRPLTALYSKRHGIVYKYLDVELPAEEYMLPLCIVEATDTGELANIRYIRVLKTTKTLSDLKAHNSTNEVTSRAYGELRGVSHPAAFEGQPLWQKNPLSGDVTIRGSNSPDEEMETLDHIHAIGMNEPPTTVVVQTLPPPIPESMGASMQETESQLKIDQVKLKQLERLLERASRQVQKYSQQLKALAEKTARAAIPVVKEKVIPIAVATASEAVKGGVAGAITGAGKGVSAVANNPQPTTGTQKAATVATYVAVEGAKGAVVAGTNTLVDKTAEAISSQKPKKDRTVAVSADNGNENDEENPPMSDKPKSSPASGLKVRKPPTRRENGNDEENSDGDDSESSSQTMGASMGESSPDKLAIYQQYVERSKQRASGMSTPAIYQQQQQQGGSQMTSNVDNTQMNDPLSSSSPDSQQQQQQQQIPPPTDANTPVERPQAMTYHDIIFNMTDSEGNFFHNPAMKNYESLFPALVPHSKIPSAVNSIPRPGLSQQVGSSRSDYPTADTDYGWLDGAAPGEVRAKVVDGDRYGRVMFAVIPLEKCNLIGAPPEDGKTGHRFHLFHKRAHADMEATSRG